ncbi:ParA family protein [Gorillibacterium massiliense]|uniref:ParA family protein n=1 Tax=Gorillibacterium massiliense TaxID=1280390 RepID=UPI0004AF5A11|nr:AAA family ATPase [Gorillibacterium massiliense]
MAKKIFFGNYKGGVGKTTSVYQIGLWLARKNHKILMLDLDPQCSLSDICRSKIADKNYSEFSLNHIIELYSRYIRDNLTDLDLLMRKERGIKSYLHELKPQVIKHLATNIDFVPSTLIYRNARLNDLASRMEQNPLNVFIMALFIDDLALDDEYDYILFDCPPTSNMLIHSVFLASDYYLIPTIGDKISINGVPDYITEIEDVHTRYAMNNEIGGILLHTVFKEKPKLIGVLETIYKERRGEKDVRYLKELDDAINATNIDSLISKPEFKDFRYNNYQSFSSKHIFFKDIDNLVDIPRYTSGTIAHTEYEKITEQIVQITR